MSSICLVHLFVAIGEGMKKTCVFEAVEFNANGVGGFAEFGFQSAEMSARATVKKKFLQELDPRLRCDQTVEHQEWLVE